MPRFLTGAVDSIVSERSGLQRILVGERRAYVLTQLTGPVAIGDEVVLNVTATDLRLGTGGWDVVHWNLTRREWSEPGGGHVMKLRYTSLQADTGVCEEASADVALDGLPVVVSFLHSQLAPIALAFERTAPGRRLGYVMTDTAALPMALSDLVAALLDRGLLHTTATIGQAFGGRYEAVNLAGGLGAARAAGCDAVIVGPGPGVVGTGTTYGFSGLEVASLIDLAGALGARPIVALRYSSGDSRPRHRGMSHHATTALALTHEAAVIASAAGYDLSGLADMHREAAVEIPEIDDELRDLNATTMGRGPAEDRGFFEMAAASGVVAAQMLDS